MPCIIIIIIIFIIIIIIFIIIITIIIIIIIIIIIMNVLKGYTLSDKICYQQVSFLNIQLHIQDYIKKLVKINKIK